MHIHIVGICGTFMGGVAQLAKEAGHEVTGCGLSPNEHRTRKCWYSFG